MKKLHLLAGLALFANLTALHAADAAAPSDADKLGWTLAVHSYSFRVFTIFEAIDKTAALRIKHMSISGSVKMPDLDNPTTNYTLGTTSLSDRQMEAIKAKMLSAGISWPFLNIGVVNLDGSEANARKV